MPKVFIGSSSRSLNTAREIAAWLEDARVTPVPWDDQVFKPGDITLPALEQIASEVQGAVFVFGEDDALDGGAGHVVRGNVVFEAGLFMAKLGKNRVVICPDGNPKPISNLHGVTYVDVGAQNKHKAKHIISQWAHTLQKQLDTDLPERPLFLSQFPLPDFKQKLPTAKQIRILQTFIPIDGHLASFSDELVAALHQGCEARILLCSPRSPVCEIRRQSLDSGIDVKHEVEKTFYFLQGIAREFPEMSRERLKIRAYRTLPSMAIYQVDSVIFLGHYFHKGRAISGPHLQVTAGKSEYAPHLTDEFNRIWDHERTDKDIDPCDIEGWLTHEN